MTVPGADHLSRFPVAELIDDFRTACISRRSTTARSACRSRAGCSSRSSGAGHEALGLALARHLRPGYDWFFPYYRDQALVLGLGVTPTEILLQAVGSADDPGSGGPPDAAATGGSARLNIVTQSSPTGSQCIPAVGCAEAGRYIVRRPELARLRGPRRRADLRQPRRGGVSARASSGRASTPRAICTCRCFTSCPTTASPSRCRPAIRHPAPVAELVSRLPRPRHPRSSTAPTTSACGASPARSSIACEPVSVLRSIHANVVRPYSHSAADTQSKYRSADELAEEATPRSDRSYRGRAHRGRRAHARAGSRRARRGGPHRGDGGHGSTRRRPARSAHDHRAGRRCCPIAAGAAGQPTTAATWSRWGEAIKRTLHELMAADERIRVFGEDVADARDAVLADVEGKGGVFGTTHGLQRAFGQARCFNTPLSEANIVGRAVGQAHPRAAAGARDPVLRLHLAGHDPDQDRGGDDPLALERGVHVPDGAPGADRRLPHRRGDLAQPVRREHLRPHPRSAHRVPVAGSRRRRAVACRVPCDDPVLFLEHKHLLRQPYTVDPFPPADYVIPFGRGDIRRAGDDLTIVTWGATVEKSLQAARGNAPSATARGRGGRPAHDHPVGPRDRGRVAWRRTHRLLVVHEDVLTAGFGGRGGGVGGRALLHRPRRARAAGGGRSTPTSPTSRSWSRPSCPRSPTSSTPSPTSAPSDPRPSPLSG